MSPVAGPLRITPARVLAIAAPLMFLAACGTAAVPAAGSGAASRPGPGSGKAAGAVLAAGENQVAAAGTGRDRASLLPPRVAAPATGGTTVPGAPNCPMFPASNVWNTDIS